MKDVVAIFDLKNHCGRPPRKITLKLETLAEKSAICTGEDEDPNVPIPMIEWLEDVSAGTAQQALVARHGPDIVGFIRWDNDEDLTALRGTYVKPGYRNLGLGRKLWEEAIKLFREKIDVITTSPGGEALVESMRKRHGGHQWFHESH